MKIQLVKTIDRSENENLTRIRSEKVA
jgi:hypothetical protein